MVSLLKKLAFIFKSTNTFLAPRSLGLWLFLFFVGCTSGNCRQNRIEEAPKNPSAEISGEVLGSAKDRVRVYKSDGSKFCTAGKKISLEEMKKDLKEIKVFSMNKRNDGLMRTSVCGQNIGDANTYEINQSDLAAAIKAGFSEWTFN